MAKRTTKKSSTAKRSSRKPAAARKSPEPPEKIRLRKLRSAVGREGADAAMITDPNDVAYLTGFFGGDSVLIAPARGKPLLVSDRRYEEDLGAFRHLVTVVMRTGAMHPALGRLIKDRGFGRVLVQPEHLTVQARSAVAKIVGARTLVDHARLVAGLRITKDESEIRAIRGAIRVQEAAMVATLDQIGPGLTELEICALLEYEMKARGASGPAFGTIVAAQANGSRPHYHPSKAKTARNKPLLIDWGAVVGGYRGDMTRVFTFGKWPRQVREIYEIVRDAHQAAAAALKPGERCADIDAVARDHIRSHGYGVQFGHSLGHGIGIETHEPPGLSSLAGDTVLEPGMVVTIEPGIYLPGIGGVRLEDDYAITDRGSRNLSSLPMDLDFATLD
ncbi:MAG: Xaa-Pro peptidase family protein [Planctomycetota bacterium]